MNNDKTILYLPFQKMDHENMYIGKYLLYLYKK